MHGENKTNDLYSGLIMADNSYLLIRPFIHNVLTLYLVLPFALIFGSYSGWILFNSISVLIAGLLILWTINRVTGNVLYGLYGLAIYLLNPLVLWQTSQPLAEPSVTPFVAAILAICASMPLNFKRLFTIIIILWLANMVRGVFLPALIVIPFVYLYISYTKDNYKVLIGHFFLLIVIIISLLKLQLILFGYSPFGIKDMLMNALPHGSNMDFYLFENPKSIIWSLVFFKFINNIRIQLWPGIDYAIFYVPYNIIALFLFYRIKNHNQLCLQVIAFTLILLFIHIVTILIHQNQFRYMLIPFPALLVAAIIVFNENFNPPTFFLKRFLFVLSIGLFLLSLPFALRSRSEAQQDLLLRQQIEQKISHVVRKTDRIISCYEPGYSIKAAYILRPRVIIEFPSKGSSKYFYQIISRTHPDWLLCNIDIMKRLFSEMKLSNPKIISELLLGNQKYVLVSLSGLCD